MFKKFRNLRISLAAKCQILFGAAVLLIIGAALYVPWKRMEDLTSELNMQRAEGMAMNAVLEHAQRQQLLRTPAGTLAESILPPEAKLPRTDPDGLIRPALIPLNPPTSLKLSNFDRNALRRFMDRPTESHSWKIYRLDGVYRYRLAMPLYLNAEQPSCLQCHAEAGATVSASFIPTTFPATFPTTAPSTMASAIGATSAMLATSMPTTAPAALHKLIGIVVVDIRSQVSENQLFLNRSFILLAGVIAGTLATGVFYLITTRLILQPVHVLQETAEKVSRGDLDIRSDINTGDEFQQLSETFNTMLINLKTGDEQLRAINKALDLKLVQLAETNVALYESNRLKSEFLANVSHELRTPLNSILGFAALLKETVTMPPDSKAVRYLQNILTSGRNLLDLINDLLDLAKIEAGKMEVRAEQLSLGDLFERLINLIKPLAEMKNLVIQPSVAPEVPILETDPAKIQQVLYNFLSNAIKFSPVGGVVELSAQRVDEQTVRIVVRDYGPGIEPSMHKLIFEKFRQIDGSVTRQHSGTGLGLAISRELVTLLGGQIGVDSNPGQGAAFWVILPVKTTGGQKDVRIRLAEV